MNIVVGTMQEDKAVDDRYRSMVANVVAVIFSRLDRFSPPKYMLIGVRSIACVIWDVNRATSTCITVQSNVVIYYEPAVN